MRVRSCTTSQALVASLALLSFPGCSMLGSLFGTASPSSVSNAAGSAGSDDSSPKLEGKEVVALKVETGNGEKSICPGGEEMMIMMTATLKDGRELRTARNRAEIEGPGSFTPFSDYEYSTNMAEAKLVYARLKMNHLGASMNGQKLQIEVTSKHAPGLVGKLELPITFECGLWANFDGAQGAKGATGAMGEHERSTACGQGGRGAPGGKGGPGAVGNSIVVESTVREKDGSRFAYFKITNETAGGAVSEYEVDLGRGGKIDITARGGRGGLGGDGGVGGFGDMGGPGGPGGVGGRGGDGGKITYYWDKAYPELETLPQFDVGPGAGGHAGYGGSGNDSPPSSDCPSGKGAEGPRGQSGQSGSREGKLKVKSRKVRAGSL